MAGIGKLGRKIRQIFKFSLNFGKWLVKLLAKRASRLKAHLSWLLTLNCNPNFKCILWRFEMRDVWGTKPHTWTRMWMGLRINISQQMCNVYHLLLPFKCSYFALLHKNVNHQLLLKSVYDVPKGNRSMLKFVVRFEFFHSHHFLGPPVPLFSDFGRLFPRF